MPRFFMLMLMLGLLMPRWGEAEEKVPFAHPYFWAPFILMGNWK